MTSNPHDTDFDEAARLLSTCFGSKGKRDSLIVAPLKTTITMTSIELVEYINSQREKDGAVLAHSDFLKKVPLVLGEEVAGNFSGYYKASNGKQNLGCTTSKARSLPDGNELQLRVAGQGL